MNLRLKLDANSFNYVNQEIRKLPTKNKEYEVLIRDWDEKRSLSANAQQQVWYDQISEHYGVTKKEAEQISKRDFGLAILLGMEEYGAKVNYVLEKVGFWSMSLEQQANVMDLIQVTSLFKTKQHNLYREQLQRHWEQLGLMLEYRK